MNIDNALLFKEWFSKQINPRTNELFSSVDTYYNALEKIDLSRYGIDGYNSPFEIDDSEVLDAIIKKCCDNQIFTIEHRKTKGSKSSGEGLAALNKYNDYLKKREFGNKQFVESAEDFDIVLESVDFLSIQSGDFLPAVWST